MGKGEAAARARRRALAGVGSVSADKLKTVRDGSFVNEISNTVNVTADQLQALMETESAGALAMATLDSVEERMDMYDEWSEDFDGALQVTAEEFGRFGITEDYLDSERFIDYMDDVAESHGMESRLLARATRYEPAEYSEIDYDRLAPLALSDLVRDMGETAWRSKDIASGLIALRELARQARMPGGHIGKLTNAEITELYRDFLSGYNSGK